MGKPTLIRKSFNGGEIAPELHYRSDLDVYHKSCKTLKNMVVTPWGMVTRRPPTELLSKIDTSLYGVPVKYIPFRFSLTETFHIVFTDGSGSESTDSSTADVIVFDADGNIQTIEGSSTKILSTVYDSDDLVVLHHIQVNDFIYMTCGGDYPVQTISRFFDSSQSANRWKISEFDLRFGPFTDHNDDIDHRASVLIPEYDAGTTYSAGDTVWKQVTETIDGKSVNYWKGLVSQQDSNTGNAITNETWWKQTGAESSVTSICTITTTKDTFSSNDVGRIFAISDLKTSRGRLRGKWNSDNVSGPLAAYGEVTLITEGGAWGGDLILEQMRGDPNDWEELGRIRSYNGSYNGSINRTVSGLTSQIRVRCTNYITPSSAFDNKACIWRLEFSQKNYQLFKISNFVSATNVTAEAINPLSGESLNSSDWVFGAFSESTGYPNTLTIHDERMVFGGSKLKPNTVWASRINDWTNFLEGDTEVSPYNFTIKSDSFDTIRWMRSTRNLMIGTENSETTMGTRDDTSVISPKNIDVQTQTYFGSANIQAIVTADLVFFVQGQSKRVRSTQYDFVSDQYLSSEMSIFAHHITSDGIKEMSFRRHPYSSIFFVLNSGEAVSFTYEKEQQVKGWSRFVTSGSIISAASNYSEVGDIVAGVIKRGSDYYLEKFGTFDQTTVFLDNQIVLTGSFDSGVSISQYGNVDDLVVVNNDVQLDTGSYTLTTSSLTIPGYTSGDVTLGVPFESVVEPTDVIEFGEHGSTKRATKLTAYLRGSGGVNVWVNHKPQQFTDGLRLAAGERLTGDYEFTVGGGYQPSIAVKLSTSQHTPLNLIGLGYRIS